MKPKTRFTVFTICAIVMCLCLFLNLYVKHWLGVGIDVALLLFYIPMIRNAHKDIKREKNQ